MKDPVITDAGYKLWPFIWCVGENLAVAVSTIAVERKQTVKVGSEHWGVGKAKYRNGYKIDFSKIKIGDMVFCPKCGAPVDFRLMPSNSVPKLV